MNNNPDNLQTASLYVQGANSNGWPNSVVWFQNTASSTNNAPALRVVNTSANATNTDGALSVSIQGQGLIAEFGNSGAFVVTITNNGTVYATAFVGNGAALTSLNASQISSGTVPLAQLPAAIVTNNSTGLTLSGAFNGNGGGLTNLNVANLKADGAQNVLAGSGNVVGGNGVENTAIGYQAFFSNNEGDFNTAVGYQALFSNTGSSDYSKGNFNTASGFQALYGNTTGVANTAEGTEALYYNISGNNNTASGGSALARLGAFNNAGGTNNIALGYQAGYNFTGNESGNIDIGNLGIAGDNNIIRIGSSQPLTYLAGFIIGNGGGLTNLNVANLKADGAQNVLAGSGNVVGGNGTENTAIGYESFFSNNEGDFNTAVGYKALFSNTGSSDYSGGTSTRPAAFSHFIQHDR